MTEIREGERPTCGTADISVAHDDRRQAVADDPIHNALRAKIEVETERDLWVPADAIRFTPPLADTIFGDGRALFAFTTINDRPAFWVVRGDSRWSVQDWDAPAGAPEVHDVIDDVMVALEEEFGSGRWDEDDEGNEVEGQPFPAINDQDGCSWGRVSWPVLSGINIEPHPFARGISILTYSQDDAGTGGIHG